MTSHQGTNTPKLVRSCRKKTGLWTYSNRAVQFRVVLELADLSKLGRFGGESEEHADFKRNTAFCLETRFLQLLEMKRMGSAPVKQFTGNHFPPKYHKRTQK